MEVIFRKATLNDLESLIDLCDSCFLEKTNLERATKLFKKTIVDDSHIYLVGEINGEIVAHTKITIVYTMFEQIDVFALLNHVCVKETYRGQGIASKMLKECEKIARTKGCKKIRLWSTNSRIAAHSCYKKIGYTEDNVTNFSFELL